MTNISKLLASKKKSLAIDEEQNEIIEKLITINRTTKVVRGGRNFSFTAYVVVGDGAGRVGFGRGKAKEVIDAKKKATQSAKRNLMRVALRESRTLHHDAKGHDGSAKVFLRTAPQGTGIIAGGPMRAVFEALGVKDVVAKSNGTSNPFNMVRATLDALSKIESPKAIANRRDKKVSDIIKQRQAGQTGSVELGEDELDNNVEAA